MDATNAGNRPAEQLLDIPALIGILWYRKLVILACVVVMVLIAVAYSVVTPSSYTAKAVILLDPRESVTISSTNVLGGIGSDSAAIASQVTVISSPELLRQVFDAENLAQDPEFSRAGLISGMLSLLRGSIPAKTEATIFESFRSRVAVEREGLTYILNVGFVSGDAQKAARIVNAIVSQYISGQIAEKSGANTEVTGLLNDRIGDLREAVTQAERAVEAYRTENNIFDVGAGRTLLDTQVERLNAQWVTAQETVRAATNRYEQARTIGTSPQGLARLTDILSSPAAAELRSTYNLRLSALANSQATLGDRHPTRVALEAEVSRLTTLMRGEAERIIAELRAAKELADASVIRIETDLAMLRGESSTSNQQSIQLRQLERNAEASRQVLVQFLSRSEETSQLEQLQKSDARVISSATPPISATWPRSSLIVAVAGMLGFMMGGALALLLGGPNDQAKVQKQTTKRNKKKKRSGARNKKRSKRLPEPQTQVPAADRQKVRAARQVTLHSRYQSTAFDELSQEQLEDIQLEVADYPESPFAVETRKLMYRLFDTETEQEGTSIFLFSAAAENFEKVRLAYAMALTMRAEGLNPLILDLDPMQANTPGINDLLNGYLHPDPETLIDPTTGLTILSAENADEDIDELIAEALDLLDDTFDAVVIIGSRTLGRRNHHEASQYLDREIIVLSENENQRRAMSQLNKRGRSARNKTEFVTISHGEQGLGAVDSSDENYQQNNDIEEFEDDYDEEDVVDAVADLRRVVRYAGER